MNIKAYRKNRGFTLVELIVVLIILAILAAILIPSLIGYIDKAREGKYLSNAKACKDAAQAKFVEQYGLNGEIDPDYPVIANLKPGSVGVKDTGECYSINGDMDIVNSEFAKEVLSMAGTEPYFFMVAVGSNQNRKKNMYAGEPLSTFDKYTVYYAAYIEEEGSKPWYYYNNEWTTTSPRFDDNGKTIFNGNNVVISGPLKGKRLQYYLIANKNSAFPSEKNDMKQSKTFDNSAFWTWLNSMK